MTIGPAPMMRMVDMSVRLGIKSRGLKLGTKKGRAAARPLSKSAIFAREVCLDQISEVGKDYKGFINRQLGPFREPGGRWKNAGNGRRLPRTKSPCFDIVYN